MAKAVEALPRQWGSGQGRGGVAKDVERGQGLGDVAKTVRANPNPSPKALGA